MLTRRDFVWWRKSWTISVVTLCISTLFTSLQLTSSQLTTSSTARSTSPKHIFRYEATDVCRCDFTDHVSDGLGLDCRMCNKTIDNCLFASNRNTTDFIFDTPLIKNHSMHIECDFEHAHQGWRNRNPLPNEPILHVWDSVLPQYENTTCVCTCFRNATEEPDDECWNNPCRIYNGIPESPDAVTSPCNPKSEFERFFKDCDVDFTQPMNFTCRTCRNNTVTGAQCNMPNRCNESPPICQNGGVCKTMNNGLLDCNCVGGFEGEFCQTLDRCRVETPCRNGASCSRIGNDDYNCTCTMNFTGKDCQNIKRCNNASCPNSVLGSSGCEEIEATNDFFCERCKPGWDDDSKCEIADPCILDNACNPFGNCSDCCVSDLPIGGLLVKSHTCNCTSGNANGNQCEFPNLCTPSNPCVNNGNCTEDDGDFICTCPPGFDGNNCQIEDVCETIWKDKCGNGECSSLSTVTTLHCDCDNGIIDSEREKCNAQDPCFALNFLNELDWKPCTLHQGQLVPHSSTNCTCICSSGFHGEACEFKDGCESNPCVAMGFRTRTCESIGNNFICNCNNGFRGRDCSDEDVCVRDPAACSDINGNLNTCQFTGDEDYICQFEGGNCTNENKIRQLCTCLNGWSGISFCENRDPCFFANSPCNNHGTCQRINNTEFSCSCDIPWEGEFCDVFNDCNIIINTTTGQTQGDLCLPNGECFNQVAVGQHICNCDDGFHGDKCQFIDSCFSLTPCQNEGKCLIVPDSNNYICDCSPGFLDQNCSSRDACFANTNCRNGGSCLRMGETYTCACGSTSFDGTHCDIRNRCKITGPCPFPSRFIAQTCFPCESGTCVAANVTVPFTYHCECGNQKVGRACEFNRAIIDFRFPIQMEVGETKVFLVAVLAIGDDLHIRLDLGNQFVFVINPSHLRPSSQAREGRQAVLLGEDGQRILLSYPTSVMYYAFPVQYKTIGRVNVTSTFFNGDAKNSHFSGENITQIQVVEPSICLPTVNLLNCGQNINQLPVYRRTVRFVIPASIYDNCNATTSGRGFSYEWDLFHLNSITPFPDSRSIEDLTLLTGLQQNVSKFVVFPALKLSVGIYWIQVFVFLNEDRVGRGSIDYCYFEIKPGPPLPTIKGGAARTIDPSLGPFKLEASDSTDESFDEKSNFLEYQWTFDNSIPCSRISASPCTSSVLTIDPNDLNKNEYLFRVNVRNPISGLASFIEQRIVIQRDSLEIHINCIKNCGTSGKWSRNEKFLLHCSCPNCPSSEQLIYTHSFDNLSGIVTEPSPGRGLFRVQLSDVKLISDPLFNCFGRNTLTNRTGSSSFVIDLNPDTIPGNCTVNPSKGTFIQTKFSVTCTSFDSVNDPLVYIVYAKPAGTPLGLFDKGLLMFNDISPALMDLNLPLGSNESDWRVDIQVEVMDSFGYIVRAPPVEIQVSPPEFTERTIPSQLFDELENGNFSRTLGGVLKQRLTAGDNQRALQLILNLLHFPIGSPSLKEFWTDQDRFLEVIGEALLQVPLYSQFIVSQVNQALNLLLQNDNMTDTALKLCAQILHHVANDSLRFVTEHEEVVSTEDISGFSRAAKDSARIIMTQGSRRGTAKIRSLKLQTSLNETVIDILEDPDDISREYFADLHDDLLDTNDSISDLVNNNLVEEIQNYARITLQSYYAVEHVLDASAEREVISDRIDFIESSEPELSASVQVMSANELAGKTFVNARVGFIIPNNAEKFLPPGIAHPIQIEMTETNFSVNPFFDDLNFLIQTPVASLILKDQNLEELPIEFGEDSPIDIFLPFNAVTDINSQAAVERVTVRFIPFSKIDQSNTDVKIFHLTLYHGAKYSVTITTEMKTGIQYLVTAVRDVLPDKIHFCSNNENITRILNDSFTTTEFDAGNLMDDNGTAELVDFYVGIWPFDETEIGISSANLTYAIGFSQRNCFIRNEDLEKWEGLGCEVGELGNSTHIHCRCRHLSIFAGSIFVPPNNLDIVNDIELILEIDRNPVVVSTVAVVIVFYIILLVICVLRDSADRSEHFGITIMTEIGEDFKNTYYLITVVTGSRPFAGTTANISIQIYGSNGRSVAYVIKDQTISVLNRGGIDSFLISSVKDLGELDRIRIWHDNFGEYPGWYLRKVIIRDVKTDQEWHFFVQKWLSVSNEADPVIIREINVAAPAEALQLSRRFNERLVNAFNNTHLWLSVFLRMPSSNFTRAQRLSCAVAILTSYMLINIMFHGIPLDDFQSMIEFGDFTINLLRITHSIQTALLALPFGLFLVLLFQRIRKRGIPTLIIWKNSEKRRPRTALNESHIFLPSESGRKQKHIVKFDTRKVVVEENRPFAIPETDIKDLEKWIDEATRGITEPIPPYLPSPDRFTRRIGDDGDAGSTKKLSNMLRVGRRAIIASVRERDPYSFCYAGDNDNRQIEKLIDDEIKRHAESEHTWTRTRKEDLDRINCEMQQEIPKFLEPVRVVQIQEVEQNSKSYFGIALELYEMPPVHKRFCYFPWWFAYFAWTLCVAIILITSFFTILYGLRYGYLKSLHWLSEISLSFLQSLLIIQPLQILIVAFILTVIYRKVHFTEEDRFQVLLMEGDEDIGKPKPLRLRIFRPSRNYPPLSGHETFKLRIKARRRKMLRMGLISIVFHVFLMIFLIVIAHSHHSTNMFLLTNNVRNMLELHVRFDEQCEGDALDCDDSFSQLTTDEEFYDYLRVIFLDVVNPRFRFDGSRFRPLTRTDPVTLKDDSSYLIGVPRIRQIRIRRDTCRIPESLKAVIVGTDIDDEENTNSRNTFPCTGHYSEDQEDKETYNPNWQEVQGERTWESTNDVWKYKDENETKSIRMEGEFGSYGGGGFVAELGKEFLRSSNVLFYLQKTDWIDGRTRVIFVEFLIFNANVNLFADVVLMVEKSPSQGLRTSSQITCLRLNLPDEYEGYLLFLVISHLIVLLFLVILTFLFIKSFLYHWRYYGILGMFKRFWLWSDLAQILITALAFGVAVDHALLLAQIRNEFEAGLVNEYISFQQLAKSETYLRGAFAGALCLCIIKFWKLLVFTFVRFYIMALTLRLTARFLIAFLLLLIILISAFAIWAYLSFGSVLEKFHTFRHAFFELIHQLLNVTLYEELYSANRFIGPIFYFLFGFFVSCIGLNLFIALLNQGLLESKEIANQRPSWITYWTYIKRLYFHIFPKPYKPNPHQKLTIHPAKVYQMKRTTAIFIRKCLDRTEIRRMSEMRVRTEIYLRHTQFTIISKNEKWRRIRSQMNTARVPESRMEEMRLETISFIRAVGDLDIKAKDLEGFAKFNFEILKIRLRKIHEKADLLKSRIDSFVKSNVVKTVKQSRWPYRRRNTNLDILN